MQSIFHTASLPVPTATGESDRSTQRDGRLYQAATVLAILMVLGSFWGF